MYISAMCYALAGAAGIVLGIQHGFANFHDSYLIPPGTFGHTPLYFPVAPYNLVLWSGFAFWLLYRYGAASMPVFFLSFSIWDMTTIQFPYLPKIYFVVYVLVLALSWLLTFKVAHVKAHLMNVWTIAMLFVTLRQPAGLVLQLLFGVGFDPFVPNQVLYDAVFFVFVWKSFSPRLNSPHRDEAHGSSDNGRSGASGLEAR